MWFPLAQAVLHAIADQWQAERDRWILWAPVCFGCGIAAYFALDREPSRWIGPVLLILCAGAGALGRRWPPVVFVAMALGLAAAGFTLATERSAHVAAPILQRQTGIIAIEGRVAELEPLERGEHRVVLDQLTWPEGWNDGPQPLRVRLRLRGGTAPPEPGSRVAARTALMPPPAPAAPGAFDFARQAWFLGIGAVGYAIGPLRSLAEPAPADWRETLRLDVAALRQTLTTRITAAIAGGGMAPSLGAVAASLVTGERGAVAPDLLQAYRDAGLAHILVIAGMHMSMVAGLVFVALRAALAAIPPIALRFPIKKWTAFGAFLVTTGYLVVSGAPVPTQRAFIMNGVLLVAVLLDREAVSLRSISAAAIVVLALHPEALIGPSFQMSFAAVYGLIAGYEVLGPRLAAWRRHYAAWWLEPIPYVAGILLTTQIAGAATAFFTVYHFNRYASYGLLGNLIAVPIVGFWVMPSALLAFCLMPFGLDGFGWRLMGHGIALVNAVALRVSRLPGAAIDLPSVPVGALAVFALGGLWLCLWRRPWRLFGLVGMAAGLVAYALQRPPDLIIAEDSKLVALRGADGRLALPPGRADRAVRESWTRQAGQGTTAPTWSSLGIDRLRCDVLGCVYRANGHIVAVSRDPRSLAEDCRAADLVIASVPLRTACPAAMTIDAAGLRRDGAVAVWLEKAGTRALTVSAWQGDRSWGLIRRANWPVSSHGE